MLEPCIPGLHRFWAGCVSHRRCLLPWGDKLGHVRSLMGDKINPVFSDSWWLCFNLIKVLLKNPSLAVYLLFLMSATMLKQCLESVFSVLEIKLLFVGLEMWLGTLGEGSGTDLIVPRILSTGLSVLRKSIGIF